MLVAAVRRSRSAGLGAGKEPSSLLHRLIPHALIARQSAAAPKPAERT